MKTQYNFNIFLMNMLCIIEPLLKRLSKIAKIYYKSRLFMNDKNILLIGPE